MTPGEGTQRLTLVENGKYVTLARGWMGRSKVRRAIKLRTADSLTRNIRGRTEGKYES